MNFLELARARYSVRAYKDTAVEEEKLAAIIEAGRVAPTAKNNQPQRVYIAKSERALSAICENCRYTFGAPVVLVIGYDTEREWKNPLCDGVSSGETDAAIITTHMMMAAADLGLGSCWVGYFNADDIAKTLELPENIQITAMLPIGYPADDAAPIDMHYAVRDIEDTVKFI